MKILFLDLSGTIRKLKKQKPDPGYLDNQEPIPGALERMQEYSDDGYIVIGITNQGEVPKHKELRECILEQEETLRLFPLLKNIYFAPGNGSTCWRVQIGLPERKIKGDGKYCKPETGMIRAALKDFATDQIEHILMIGDRQEDMICAENAGIDFKWARHWLDPMAEFL